MVPTLFTPPRGFVPPRGLITNPRLGGVQELRPREIPRPSLVHGRDKTGHIRWSGRFRNNRDAYGFIQAALTGELWFDTDLWHLPSPQWHPDYGPLEYQFGLSLDGSGKLNTSNTQTPHCTLTTTNSNDVIIVAVANNGGGTFTVNSIAGTGIANLTARQGAFVPLPSSSDFEVWWGTAASPLSAVTITATLSGTPSGNASSCVAFGVTGALSISPWDTNSGLPKAVALSGSSQLPAVTGVSTSHKNGGWLLGFTYIPGGGPETPGAGYAIIADTSGASIAGIAIEYQDILVSQSNVTVAFGTAVTSSGTIADSLIRPDVLMPQILL